MQARGWVTGAAFLWAALCLAAMLSATGGHLSMPLDDAFIFFQYAKTAVAGSPLAYQPGDPISSGVTSHLTLLVDTVGYLVGFRGSRMVIFALLVGTLGLAWAGASAWRLGERLCPRVRWLPPALLLLSGPLGWGFLSGMDLPLFVALALAFAAAWPESPDARPRNRLFVLGAFLGLARPDALFLLLPAAAFGMSRWPTWRWLVPLTGAALPFLIQGATTGSLASASLEVKSVLAEPGQSASEWLVSGLAYLGLVLKGVLGGGEIRDATTFAANNGSAIGFYLVPFALGFAMLGLVPGAWADARRRVPGVSLLLLSWFTLLLLAQAFTVPRGWHWHRYLIPLYAFLIPGIAVGADRAGRWVESVWDELRDGDGARAIGTVLVLFSLPGAAYFVLAYGRNCADIYFQHIELAGRLNAGDPARPRLLGLHDAGALTYYGNFPVVDLEGLVTPAFRRPARNGGASVWEELERWAPDARPDLLALYAGWFEPGFLELHPRIHSQRLFRASIVAGNPLHVLAADWSGAGSGDLPRDPSVVAALEGLRLRTQVDIADLTSEESVNYGFRALDGAYESVLRSLASGAGAVIDGGRMISGEERFTMTGLTAGAPLLLVTRSHAPFRIRVDVDGVSAGTWVETGGGDGRWFESVHRVPGSLIPGTEAKVRLASDDPHHSAYGSFHYWAYQR